MDPAAALLTVAAYVNTQLSPAASARVVAPVRAGSVSSDYGVRADPFHGAERFHEGIDIGARAGSAIYAVAAGEVFFSGQTEGYGRVVGVRHNGEVTTLYAHCWATRVVVGDRVVAGSVLGFVGRTGRATGPHLHFEVRVRGKSVDPLSMLRPHRVRSITRRKEF